MKLLYSFRNIKCTAVFLLCILLSQGKIVAQTTITTNGTATYWNTTSCALVFGVQNTNTYPIMITDLSNYMAVATTAITFTLWTHTTMGGAPGAITAANGWVLTSYTNSRTNATAGIVPIFSNMSLVIPANSSLRLALVASASGPYYASSGSSAATFSGGGVNLLTQNNATSPTYVGDFPSAITNTPRGFYGSITFKPACTAPAGIAVSGLTKTTANITWNAATGAGYEYVLDQVASDPTTSGTTTTATSRNFSGLTAGTTYYFHIRTNCTSTFSGWATFSFTTPICSPVVDLKISNVTESSAQFDWTNLSVATDGYEYFVTMGTEPPPSSVGTQHVSGNTAAIQNLTANTLYNVFIRSRCTGNDSSIWKQYSFTTFGQCTPPVLTASQVERNQWKIDWESEPSAVAYEYALGGLSTPTIGTTIYTNNVSVGIPDDGAPYYLYARTKCYNIFNTSPWGRVELRAPLTIANNKNKNDIEVYPNPFKDKFTFHINGSIDKGSRLTVTDVSGRIIFDRYVNESTTIIDVAQQPTGIYFVKYTTAGTMHVLKINKL